MKKRFITLGAISSIVPIAAVISCGSNDVSVEQATIRRNLHSDKAMDLIELRWQQKVLQTENNRSFEYDVKNTNDLLTRAFEFIIKKHIYKDPAFLTQISIEISKMNEFLDYCNKLSIPTSPNVVLASWNLNFSENGVVPAMPDEAKTFIMQHDVGKLQKEVYKLAISYLYLNKGVNDTEYKKLILDDENAKLTPEQKLFNSDEFVLLNEAVNQHLFAKWELSSDSSNLQKATGENTAIDTEAHVVDEMKVGGNLFEESKYSERNATSTYKELNDTLAPSIGTGLGGFVGIEKISGKGILLMNSSKLKLATDKDDWNGWLQEEELIETGNADNEIKLFAKDELVNAKITRIFGFMPGYNPTTKKITFEEIDEKTHEKTYFGLDQSGNKLRDFMILTLASEETIYTNAMSYFTKRENRPIKLQIIDSEVRSIALDHGFKFIEEE